MKDSIINSEEASVNFYVPQGSIVRRIWGSSDAILLIFAGAAGEFALSKAVDWLFYTGKLPKDPIGRLFSTVNYAKAIVFSEQNAAIRSIDSITAIHGSVESSRGYRIPDWAYRHVLYMLIHYSMRAYETLERPMTDGEKVELLNVFLDVGRRMGISDLPNSLGEWEVAHQHILSEHLEVSANSKTLFEQYKKHLGPFRYWLLRESQRMVVPKSVGTLLGFRRISIIVPIMPVYRLLKRWKMDWLVKTVLLPKKYHQQIRNLEVS